MMPGLPCGVAFYQQGTILAFMPRGQERSDTATADLGRSRAAATCLR